MAYNRENYLRIKEEFAHRHDDRVAEAEERTAELEAQLPELREINTALRRSSAAVCSAVFRGMSRGEGEPRPDPAAELAEIRAENERLLRARAELLTRNGYAADYLEPRFACKKCADRGSVGLRMCSCMREELIMAGYESSGIGNLLRGCTFDGFDLSHFSGDGRIIMENNLAICRSYAEEFTTDADTVCGDKKNLLLYGLTGLGKTHLSAAIAARLIRRGYDVVYETAINLFGTFERERFMRDDRNGRRESERYFDCDVLIIDDLGTELSNQFTATVLFNVINTRLCRGSATIINTNLSQKEIRERYDGRTSSRIFGEFRPLPFVGTDYRLLKLER